MSDPVIIKNNVRTAGLMAPPQTVAMPPIPNSVVPGTGVLETFGSTLRNVARKIGGQPFVPLGTVNATRAAQQLPRALDPATQNGRVPLADQQSMQGSEGVRVMTFNIRGGIGQTGSKPTARNLQGVAEAVKRHRPDVVLLQEVDDFATRSAWSDNIDTLARTLQPSGFVAATPTRYTTGRGQHVGIMTFNGFSIDNARNVISPEPVGDGTLRRVGGVVGSLLNVVKVKPPANSLRNYQPRNTVDALVRTPGGAIMHVASTHLGGTNGPNPEKTQSTQLAPVLAALQGWNGPTLFGGDLNIRSGTKFGEREKELLGKQGLRDAFTAVGIDPNSAERVSTPTGARIDRVYASPHFAAKKIFVDRTNNSSDHWPVIADFSLARPTLEQIARKPPPQ